MENVHPPRNGSSNGFDPDLLVIHSRIQGIRGLSDRRSVSPWSNGGGAVSTSVLRETFWKGGREEGRRAFAKEGGGEEAENRIDMRQVGGKGEGGRWARGRERSERGREGMEKEEEREGARLERGTQRVERGVGSGGELASAGARRGLEREGREGSCKRGAAWPLVRGRESAWWVEEDGSSVMETSVWLVAVRRPAPLLRYLTARSSVFPKPRPPMDRAAIL